MPRASLRSVLLICACNSGCMRRVSTQITGNYASASAAEGRGKRHSVHAQRPRPGVLPNNPSRAARAALPTLSRAGVFLGLVRVFFDVACVLREQLLDDLFPRRLAILNSLPGLLQALLDRADILLRCLARLQFALLLAPKPLRLGDIKVQLHQMLFEVLHELTTTPELPSSTPRGDLRSRSGVWLA